MADLSPAERVARCGGLATRAQIAACGPRAIAAAVAAGEIVRVRRGLYRLPDVDRALRLAAECGGQVALLHAAQAHGWEVALLPDRPTVKLPSGGHVRPVAADTIWGEVDPTTGRVTSQRLTVVDCARRLPLRDALPVLDSALRHGYDPTTLLADARAVRGKGAAAARRAAELASGLAANPFESRLRALAVDAGLDVRPQVTIGLPAETRGTAPATVRPDVVDVGRRLVLEADSWEFHSSKEAFQADCLRYTALTVAGWTVLRFTWWQVMHDPGWVITCLARYAERAA
ncbi:type IV toxin-antitoxin system AbiEi family antitoxin domain-containing protein [Nocardioides zeae]|uniref:DUF559 domain-containing protein n=1 Tax=Nocardioides zeae TaxID=1457234 RepID=A0AAJ1U017_9ACTN|nr:type IV toxin-antitoxin system AbiEi family antitoxin domain-containing protein [Nocardioides zeae]MDQ1105490.1 hypothetical protein [Nocardioides zeae]